MIAHPDLSAVSIVILSYNRKGDLEANLRQLLAMVSDLGCELIVVDNASTDGSAEVIRDMLANVPGARAFLNGDNLGVAGGRNTGWRAASREFILNIDDDTIITVEAVAALLSFMRKRHDVGVVSPRILHARTKALQCDFGNAECPVGNFHGACHMLRASLVKKVGLNDKACSFGGEELDYSIRARAAGFDIAYTPDATVLHNNHVRQGTEGRNRRARWVYNFIRVHNKHFPLRTAAPFSLRYLLSNLVSGVRVHGPVFGLRLIVAAAHGFRDGRCQYRTIPEHVVRFYRDPDLRPEFGNVPLWRKIGAFQL